MDQFEDVVEVESVALRGSEVTSGLPASGSGALGREGDDLGRDLRFCEECVGIAERGGCTTGGTGGHAALWLLSQWATALSG